MATTISTLAAKLVLDTSQWIAGFVNAGRSARTFSSSITQSITTRFGAAATAAIGAATSISAVRGAMERIDRNAKLADRLGITNEAMQKLGLAAQLSGVDVETLHAAMIHMARTVGSGGQALDKRFFAIADSITKIKDPAQRAAKAFQIARQGCQVIKF